jgi:hypothetical protein
LPDAGGGSENLNAILTEQENLISTLKERLEGKSAGIGTDVLNALITRTITEFSDPTLTEVGRYAFIYCDKLASIDLPAVKTIGAYAFGGCSSLSAINFPLLKKVDTNTFRGCQNLVTADFGKLTTINTYAFYACNALTTLILRAPSVCYITTSGVVFDGSPIASGEGYVYVPRALIEDYKVATNWTLYSVQFRAIEDYPDICGGGS